MIFILFTHLLNRLNENEKQIVFFFFDKGALYVGLFYFYSGYGLMKSIVIKISFLCFNFLQNSIYIIFVNDVFYLTTKSTS